MIVLRDSDPPRTRRIASGHPLHLQRCDVHTASPATIKFAIVNPQLRVLGTWSTPSPCPHSEELVCDTVLYATMEFWEGGVVLAAELAVAGSAFSAFGVVIDSAVVAIRVDGDCKTATSR